MVYIETPHLLLRDWEEEDILPFVRMNSDKEVMEFFLTTLTEEETMAFYCRIRKEFEEYGYGLYAVECKEFVDVSKVCGYFNGGGHTRAAGCIIDGDFESVVNLFLERLKSEYPNEF